MLDKIVAATRGCHPLIIAGDFNAWAVEWGSKYTNARGYTLLETFAQLDVSLVNKGLSSTFRRNGRESVIDITFASNTLIHNMSWKVSEEYTHSDHQAVLYMVKVHNEPRVSCQQRKQKTGWREKEFDEELLVDVFNDTTIPSGTAEEKAEYVARQLAVACDVSMPRRVTPRYIRKSVYWWSDEIQQHRKKCLQTRRKAQRSIGKSNHDEWCRQHKAAKKKLAFEIRRRKRLCFAQLCEQVDNNPWGEAYKIVTAKIKGYKSQQEKCPDMLRNIVVSLFPQHPSKTYQPWPDIERSEIPPVTEKEVLEATLKIIARKAPGPDLIPNKALKAAINSNPALFRDVMQTCLEEGCFPRIWKKQKLVLIPKPGKPPGEPSSYRPICLLDTAGKILERIIQNRLICVTEGEEGLSNRQFGFRKARSTVDAITSVVNRAREAIEGRGTARKYCVIVTLDVKNAFNSARWEQIMEALRSFRVPTYLLKLLDNYFNNRVLMYESSEGCMEYNVSAGVPQGSVLGPILWNIMYNGVLKLGLPKEAEIIGFADDLAIVVTSRYLDGVELVASESVKSVSRWLKSVGLELAEHKTEMVLISNRRANEVASIRIGKHFI